MTYQSALDFILSFADYERATRYRYSADRFDLRRVEDLLDRLGAPHRTTPSVHVAGTKGKGSTAALLASVLRAAGYRVGLFTSPHLHSYRERLTVDGEPIAEAELVELVAQARPAIEAVQAGPHGRLTVFEITTALALLHFVQRRADLAVLETGLGGRLDATNVVQPLVSVLTSISLDHTAILGESLEQIAREKAGIIKPGVPVVSSPQPPEALRVVEGSAAERGARLVLGGRDFHWARQLNSHPDTGQWVAITTDRSEYVARLPLLGAHQAENAATAVAALEEIDRAGKPVPTMAFVPGLEEVSWPGRLQVLGRQPWVLVDGAHNVDSTRRLLEALDDHFSFDRLVLVFGCSADKDLTGMATLLGPRARVVLAVAAEHPRAASPEVVAASFRAQDAVVEEAPSLAAALERALELASPGDLICVTGSLFVVAEAIRAFGGVLARARRRVL